MHKERIKLTDWLYGKYSAKSVFNATWVSDTEIVYFDKIGNFKMYDVNKFKSEIIVDGSIVVSLNKQTTTLLISITTFASSCKHSNNIVVETTRSSKCNLVTQPNARSICEQFSIGKKINFS